MSVSIPTLEETDCILLFGYNPAASHPIVARRIVNAKERGADLIVCDPRVIESARIADMYLPLKNGSNLALLNAFAYAIIDEELATGISSTSTRRASMSGGRSCRTTRPRMWKRSRVFRPKPSARRRAATPTPIRLSSAGGWA